MARVGKTMSREEEESGVLLFHPDGGGRGATKASGHLGLFGSPVVRLFLSPSPAQPFLFSAFLHAMCESSRVTRSHRGTALSVIA